MRRMALSTMAGLAAAFAVASPASAALTLGTTACLNTDISPTASDCAGWYEGNLNGGSPEMRADTATALNGLLGTSFTADNFPSIQKIDVSGGTVDFDALLVGETVVSFHVGGAGGAGGVGYEGTAFYVFDAGSGLDEITFNLPGLSNAQLYSTGVVPEPATWAMMLMGFGLVGGAMRRRNRASVRVTYA